MNQHLFLTIEGLLDLTQAVTADRPVIGWKYMHIQDVPEDVIFVDILHPLINTIVFGKDGFVSSLRCFSLMLDSGNMHLYGFYTLSSYLEFYPESIIS